MFYKFIWNGGNDRVKMVYVRNHFNHCGLRMIDTYNFSLAQKWHGLSSFKLLFDKRYDSFWKTIELSDMDYHYGDLLWNSCTPDSFVTQLADSLRTWYRERACQEIYGKSFSDFGYLQCLWYNRNIRSKTKNYIYYEDCLKEVLCILMTY